MNKLMITIITVLVTAGVGASESHELDHVGFLSMNGSEQVFSSDESQALSLDENSAKVYEHRIGEDAFLVALPRSNAVQTVANDSVQALVSVSGGVEYWVMKSKNDLEGLTAEQLFPSYIERHSQAPYQMLENSVSVEDGLNVLKITSLNENTGKIEEMKIVEKSGEFYVAIKKTPVEQELQNDYFFDSFAVLN